MGVYTPHRKVSPSQMYGALSPPVAPKMLEKPHNLKEYGQDHFRSPQPSPKSSVVSGPGPRGVHSQPPLWRHSTRPISEPLLSRLMDKEELALQAVRGFQQIMIYMGDMPGRQTRLGIELTDVIFNGPLKQEILRDEVYCQVMKQLTENKVPPSEERGWELMWLATGLFTCSQLLLRDLTMFLMSRERQHPIVGDCLKRLQRTIRWV